MAADAATAAAGAAVLHALPTVPRDGVPAMLQALIQATGAAPSQLLHLLLKSLPLKQVGPHCSPAPSSQGESVFFSCCEPLSLANRLRAIHFGRYIILPVASSSLRTLHGFGRFLTRLTPSSYQFSGKRPSGGRGIFGSRQQVYVCPLSNSHPSR